MCSSSLTSKLRLLPLGEEPRSRNYLYTYTVAVIRNISNVRVRGANLFPLISHIFPITLVFAVPFTARLGGEISLRVCILYSRLLPIRHEYVREFMFGKEVEEKTHGRIARSLCALNCIIYAGAMSNYLTKLWLRV